MTTTEKILKSELRLKYTKLAISEPFPNSGKHELAYYQAQFNDNVSIVIYEMGEKIPKQIKKKIHYEVYFLDEHEVLITGSYTDFKTLNEAKKNAKTEFCTWMNTI